MIITDMYLQLKGQRQKEETLTPIFVAQVGGVVWIPTYWSGLILCETIL